MLNACSHKRLLLVVAVVLTTASILFYQNLLLPTKINVTAMQKIVLQLPQLYNTSFSLLSCSFFAVIFTTVKNSDRRQAIRETWLSSKWRTAFNINYTFLLGDGDKASLASLDDEIKKYEDITVVPWFTDTYMNLTYKTIAMLQLAQERHSLANFKYLLKADDDTFVNFPSTFKLLQQCEANYSDGKFILGQVSRGLKPHRDPKSKYFMPPGEYSRDFYPPFVHGPAYAMTYPAVQILLNNTIAVPFVHLEDIYIALIAEAVNLTIAGNPGFDIWGANSWKKLQNMRSAHYMTPKLMREVWSQYMLL